MACEEVKSYEQRIPFSTSASWKKARASTRKPGRFRLAQSTHSAEPCSAKRTPMQSREPLNRVNANARSNDQEHWQATRDVEVASMCQQLIALGVNVKALQAVALCNSDKVFQAT
jgi:hypothetical protein